MQKPPQINHEEEAELTLFFYAFVVPVTILALVIANYFNTPKKPDVLTKIDIYFATYLNSSKKLAKTLSTSLKNSNTSTVSTLNLLSFPSKNDKIHIFILPTHCIPLLLIISNFKADGQPTPDALQFSAELKELRQDHRVGKGELFKEIKKFIIFGVGDANYGKDRFCTFAREVYESFKFLGAGGEFGLLVLGDTSSGDLDSVGVKMDLIVEFLEKGDFKNFARDLIHDPFAEEEGEEKDDGSEDDGSEDYPSSDEEEEGVKDILDLEDMGSVAKNLIDHAAEVEDENNVVVINPKNRKKAVKEMVTPTIRANLEKQGYKIVGSHSGVKICRWTKAMLRGRGGCYKHTFYGINSHQCMESTPSLACANKCVFCWRHGTNPVGTEWKWETNDPSLIYDGITSNHYQMINTLRGLPGLVTERFDEAKKIKHAALSLVGEPIMYPRINELLTLMHQDNVSTFMVTNAQFPDAIRDLIPVTQLYVSIDAATKESLKKVDRPLFKDFWERFIASLEEMKKKKQRTVYRLTLVKEYNTEEIDEYVELIKMGEPDFIEVKGVTFCGVGSKMRMDNVPFYNEVVSFVERVCEKLGNSDYEISCQHQHSMSVLVTHKKFKINGKWNTWIDYEKFNKLALSGEEFGSLDYCAETPQWALFGAEESGFSPNDTRFYRKKKAKNEE